jgi:hypothetical protein
LSKFAYLLSTSCEERKCVLYSEEEPIKDAPIQYTACESRKIIAWLGKGKNKDTGGKNKDTEGKKYHIFSPS